MKGPVKCIWSSIEGLTLPMVNSISFFVAPSANSHMTGSIKKGNRHGEILLRDVEVREMPISRLLVNTRPYQHVATLASIYKQGEYVYPKGKIDVSWEKILLNQCT